MTDANKGMNPLDSGSNPEDTGIRINLVKFLFLFYLFFLFLLLPFLVNKDFHKSGNPDSIPGSLLAEATEVGGAKCTWRWRKYALSGYMRYHITYTYMQQSKLTLSTVDIIGERKNTVVLRT